MSSTVTKRKHKRKPKKGVKVTGLPDDNELSYLEKLVLKSGSEVFDDISSDDDSNDETPSKKEKSEIKNKPAWVDEDDDFTFKEIVKKQGRRVFLRGEKSKKYQEVLQQRYEQVMGVPKWSKIKKSDNPAEELLNSCGKFIQKAEFLKKNILVYKTLKLLNSETHLEGSFINVVKFHSKSTVAMVAGNSGLVSLFQVNGKQNPKLQSIQFLNYPIHCGSFLRNGEEILVGSQHFKYFYSYNLMTGKSVEVNNSKIINIKNTQNFCVSPKDDFFAMCGHAGTIYLCTVSTKEYIDSFQLNSEATSLTFNHDGSLLYCHSEDGEVYIWDMKSRTCRKKFFDDGCLIGTSICTSGNDQFIACGSSSGVVNIYDTKSVLSENLSLPIKTLYNLVTPITSLQFNPTSELLFMASSYRDNAVKLLHCSSMTVFSNFPKPMGDIKKPNSVDFSPNSGFLSIGDNKGSAHLLRLKYFGNY